MTKEFYERDVVPSITTNYTPMPKYKFQKQDPIIAGLIAGPATYTAADMAAARAEEREKCAKEFMKNWNSVYTGSQISGLMYHPHQRLTLLLVVRFFHFLFWGRGVWNGRFTCGAYHE